MGAYLCIYVRMIGYSVFKSFDVSRLYVDDPLLLAVARNRRLAGMEMPAKI